MKTLQFLSIISLVLTMATGHAQKVNTYKIWVTLINQKEVKGTLYSAHEDELVILGEDLAQLKFVPGNIRVIKLRRVGKGGRGAWIGALGGFAASTMICYASESGSGWEDLCPFGGVVFGAPIGTLIGIGVGSGREKYSINGNRDAFNSLLPKLQEYAPHKSR
jgi:hypothetical protein